MCIIAPFEQFLGTQKVVGAQNFLAKIHTEARRIKALPIATSFGPLLLIKFRISTTWRVAFSQNSKVAVLGDPLLVHLRYHYTWEGNTILYHKLKSQIFVQPTNWSDLKNVCFGSKIFGTPG